MRVVLLIVAGLAAALAGTAALAEWRWRERTAEAAGRLARGAPSGPPAAFSAAAIDGLPAPVQRYFRAALREGQPMVRRARIAQRGEFLLRPTPDGWRPFTATHHAAAGPPGFVWDARIRMAPGVAVLVRDALIDGTGSMRASVGGLITLTAVEGTPGMAAGALHRYLAEAAWFPTALLPSRGVAWTPIDGSSARATLTAGSTTVSLDVHFGPDHLIRRVYAPDRARDVDGRPVPTPWEGRFSDYEERGGMRIPTRGEVAWILPEGTRAYWRGRVTDVSYGYDGRE